MAANSTTTTRFASGPGICTMHKAQCPQVGKYFFGVFEPPLPRNAQKRTKKKSQGKKKSDGGWVGLRFSKCTGGSVDFFLAAPRAWTSRLPPFFFLTTDNRPAFPSFFLLRCPLRRLWTCHRMWAPAAGCGVFLSELVPSGDPLILYMVSLRSKQFLSAPFFFPPTDIFCISSENKLSS
jgi:hypothetical protein